MMTVGIDVKQRDRIFHSFQEYVHQYSSDERQIQMNLDLKHNHCWRVAGEAKRISNSLELPQSVRRFVTAMGLLHDIGRFEQYTQYGTFVDQFSVNHAECGADLLQKREMLKHLTDDVRSVMLNAIRWHNRPHLPEDATDTELFFTKLLRDADKLDIWRVVLGYYEDNNRHYNKAISLDLPDTPGFSENVIDALIEHHHVDYRWCHNANDFKVKQMCWVFGLNYQPSLDQVIKRHIVERFRKQLPADERVDELVHALTSYLKDSKLGVNS